MRWMSLRFPDLSLESLTRAHPDSRTRPFALSARKARRDLLVAINQCAHARGVRLGQTVTAARAICTTLEVCLHDPDRERTLLNGLATSMLRFSPDVVLDPFGSGSALLVEISRTTRHFGGESEMVQQVRRVLHKLHYHHHLVVAARPEAASYLSRLHGEKQIRHIGVSALEEALNQLPWMVLEPDRTTVEHLRLSGLQTLGDIRALPFAGMEARLGDVLAEKMQFVYGDRNEPLPRHRPPRKLEEKIEWWPPTSHKSSLLFAAKRLFDQVELQLERRDEGLSDAQIFFRLADNKKELGIAIRPRRAERKATSLLKHLDNKLENVILPGAIDQMRLKLHKKLSLLPEQGLLFAEEGALYWNDEAIQLMDKLGCRLGEDRVFSPRLTEEHRPELAYTWQRAGVDEQPEESIEAAVGTRPLEIAAQPIRITIATNGLGRPEEILTGKGRGLIRVINGPERLHSGWWDGHDARRDYYVVQTKEGSRLWIYQDRNTAEWYQQGLFS
ncbi:MAG: protein ImuB [Planctomycetota bacterium]|jgi:protein ImuB